MKLSPAVTSQSTLFGRKIIQQRINSIIEPCPHNVPTRIGLSPIPFAHLEFFYRNRLKFEAFVKPMIRHMRCVRTLWNTYDVRNLSRSRAVKSHGVISDAVNSSVNT